MPLVAICGLAFLGGLLALKTYTKVVYLAGWYLSATNRATAPGLPAIDPPQMSVLYNTDKLETGANTHDFKRWQPKYDCRVIDGLWKAMKWLIDFPRFSAVPDVLMIMHALVLVILPSAEILSNSAGRLFALLLGDASGKPKAIRFWVLLMEAARAPFVWPLHVLGFTDMPINKDHSLALYAQTPVLTIPKPLLKSFATPNTENLKSNALVMARLAVLSYDRNHTAPETLKTLLPEGLTPAEQKDLGFEFVCGWNFDTILVAPAKGKPMTDAFANTDAVLIRGPGNSLILSFRGTEPLSPTDWLTDFVEADPPACDAYLDDWAFGAYHGGFRHALGLDTKLGPQKGEDMITTQYLLTTGADKVERVPPAKGKSPFEIIHTALRAEWDRHKTFKLYVTGHSLGGGLANLFTAALLVPPANASSPGAVSEFDNWMLHHGFAGVYTFGQPRVGSARYTKYLEAALEHGRNANANQPPRKPRYIRMVNCNDVVPRVPPSNDQFYQHPGHLVYVKSPPMAWPWGRGATAAFHVAPLAWLQEQPDISWHGTVWDGFKRALHITRCFFNPSTDPKINRPATTLAEVLPLWLVLPGVLPVLAALVVLAELCVVLAVPFFWPLLPGVGVDAVVLIGMACVLSTGLPYGLVDHSMAYYTHAILESIDKDWEVALEASPRSMTLPEFFTALIILPVTLIIGPIASVAVLPLVGVVLTQLGISTAMTWTVTTIAPWVPKSIRDSKAIARVITNAGLGIAGILTGNNQPAPPPKANGHAVRT